MLDLGIEVAVQAHGASDSPFWYIVFADESEGIYDAVRQQWASRNPEAWRLPDAVR
jgi:hypothetical protein